MPIRPFVEPGAFNPETISRMDEALEGALKELTWVPERIARRTNPCRSKLGQRYLLACWKP
jgi:hypothetical protein